ncbi:protein MICRORCHIDIA 6-like isoform X2 [Euphorbia lathyris]
MDVVKLEAEGGLQTKNIENVSLAKHQRSMIQPERQEFEENSASSILEQGQSHVDDTGVCSETTICPAPLCRQFWKAGNYTDTLASKATLQNGKNYLHVHPMFLHSNATSHQWAFGAIAELLDNAVDEIQNGATFVIVDKISNPRDGSPALLIQDDGGGMDPEAMRHCMSFGYSDKKSKSTIGQYGNGFKTSTMRLGADVVVFSRHLHNSTLTQSIGLLSYTFLSRTGYDRIVVPMVDYEFNSVSDKLEIHPRSGKEHYMSNLSMLLQWSPYTTEAELLQQFDDIGPHGTKVIIYNLWLSDDGNAELDFERDPEDIHISGDIKKVVTRYTTWREDNEQHIANRLHYSLRVYLSILYLRLPETFRIILRGRLVEHHNLANDLKFSEFILYIPQCGGVKEGQVITTIGFMKEAPRVNIHGFSVYHKNRLILPFWPVVSYSRNRGRGVAGVLEANFVAPTHNKQGFERTSLFQKLEARLKEMTWEYWDYHCGLLGYHVHVKSAVKGHIVRGLSTKRKERNDSMEGENLKRQASIGVNSVDAEHGLETEPVIQEASNVVKENRKLKETCREYERRKEEDDMKITKLKKELAELKCKHQRLMAEATALDIIKEEENVKM